MSKYFIAAFLSFCAAVSGAQAPTAEKSPGKNESKPKTEVTFSSEVIKDLSNEREYAWIKNPGTVVVAKDRFVLLLRDIRRDPEAPSELILKFEVISYRVAGFNPNLRLISGYSNRRGYDFKKGALTSTHTNTWQSVKYLERKHEVSIRVGNVDPKASKLENVTLEFTYIPRGNGSGGSSETKEFVIDKPINFIPAEKQK